MGTITTRKLRDGTTRYRAQVRIKKGGEFVHTESETFSKRTIAQDWIDRREKALAKPGALEALKHEGLTVGEVVQRYRKQVELTGAFGRTKVAHLKQLEGMPELAALPAVSLSCMQLIAHINGRRAEGAGPATAGNDLIWLRAAFKYGKRALGLPLPLEAIEEAAELARDERMIGRGQARTRRPTPEELEALDRFFRAPRREERSPPMRLIMWFAIYSTRRQEEQTEILRADLDRDSSTYRVRGVKHPDGSAGNDRIARMPERGWAVVDALEKEVPERPDGLLLPFKAKTIGSAFTRACRLLGIEDLHFHDLRHEGASRLAEDGATIPLLQEVTLHRSLSSLQIYVNMQGRRQRRVDFEP